VITSSDDSATFFGVSDNGTILLKI